MTMSSAMVNRFSEVTAVFVKSSENGGAGNSLQNNPSFSENAMIFYIDKQFTSNSLPNQIKISCKNTLIIPRDVEKYWIKISNSTHLLYQVLDYQYEMKMQPLSIGAVLERTKS